MYTAALENLNVVIQKPEDMDKYLDEWIEGLLKEIIMCETDIQKLELKKSNLEGKREGFMLAQDELRRLADGK